MRASFYAKLSVLMAVLSVLPAALVGYGLLTIAQRNARASAAAFELKTAQNLAANLESRARQADRTLQWAAGRLDASLPAASKKELLRSLLGQDADIENVSILDDGGRVALSVSAADAAAGAVAAASDEGLRVCLGAAAPVDRLVPAPGGSELARCVPLASGGSLYARARTAGLERDLSGDALGAGAFAVLADRQGRAAVFPAAADGPAQRVLSTAFAQGALADSGAASGRFQDASGEERLGAHAPVPALDAVVLAQQSEAAALAPYRAFRARALWILAAAALVSGLLGWLLGDWLARPIREMIAGAEAIAAGDFAHRIRVHTGDELQTLAEAVNRMTVRLREHTEMHVERLLEYQERTEAILFSIDDGIILTDYQGRIQLANRSAKSLLGRAHDQELTGEVLTDLLPDPAVREVLEEAERNPQTHLVRELHIAAGLSRRVYQVSSEPVISPHRDRSHGIVTAFHDITLEKEIERVKDEFVHSITHDLRNPMTALRGFIRFLLNELGGPLTPAQKKMVESMDKASFRLLSMINNILDVAKIDSGKMAVKVKPMSLKEVAARVVEIMTPLAIHRNIALTVEGSDPGLLVGDEDLLERVFSNLVGNAIKFTPDGGRITIGIRSDADWVQASVEDTGEGIPSQYIKRLFEKYQQVEEQRRGGTGLGLAICRFIIEAHLGKIGVESRYGQGSKFSFSLPRGIEQDASGEVHLADKVRS